MPHTTFFLLILIVQIKQLWDIQRFVLTMILILLPMFGVFAAISVSFKDDPICRSKLQWLPFVIQGDFLGPRTTRKSKMKTFWTGSKQCLDFRWLFFCWSSSLFDLFLVFIVGESSSCSFVIPDLLQGHLLLFMWIDMQKDNVANQREHLILLLANVHIRQFPKPDQQPKVILWHN